MGGYTQLDEGAGRKIWNCLDPLNCVAPAAFGKHGAKVQTCTWNFWGTLHKSADPLTSVTGVFLGVDYSSRHGYYYYYYLN